MVHSGQWWCSHWWCSPPLSLSCPAPCMPIRATRHISLGIAQRLKWKMNMDEYGDTKQLRRSQGQGWQDGKLQVKNVTSSGIGSYVGNPHKPTWFTLLRLLDVKPEVQCTGAPITTCSLWEQSRLQPLHSLGRGWWNSSATATRTSHAESERG